MTSKLWFCIRRLLLTTGLYLLSACFSFAEDVLQAKYTLSIDPHFKARDQYYIDLLELAVEKSDAAIELIPVPMPNQVESRDVINLNKKVLDIHWMHTSNELESKLIPIRIPLDRGLLGWRLILLNASNRDLLKDVDQASELKDFIFLQGYDWPDTAILMANGFRLQTSSTNFKNIFRMLKRNRTDIFPRSVLEIWGELAEQNSTHIVVEPHLLLYYPTACYFFVARKNKRLASAIEQGLKRAVDDGSFVALFEQHYGDLIEKIEIENRRIIRIDNPLLPPATPLDRKELWLMPEDLLNNPQEKAQENAEEKVEEAGNNSFTK
jgi:hypothetical protein